MVIIHIAKVYNDFCKGVSFVVPKHIEAQSKLVNVALINLNKIKIPISNQIEMCGNIDFIKFPKPFNKPDLIIFHEIYFWQYIFISAKLKRLHIPYIIIPHGSLSDNAQQYKSLKKKIANYLFFNNFINNAEAIQCLSNNEFVNTKFGKRKFIGTNGIDLPLEYKTIFNVKRIKIVFIGRLDIYYKGIDLLIKAFDKISNLISFEIIHLDIYGPLNQSILYKLNEMIVKYKLNDYISLHDAVIGKDKEKILLNSDIFIQTSRSEGMPMGILEAMSYGLPCLVTRGTSLGELIEKFDAGWVCETNIESIANCIMRCIQENELFKIKGQNARRLIKENFTWDKVTRETIYKYKELIGYKGE